LIWVNNTNDEMLTAFHPDGTFIKSYPNNGDPNGQGIDANGDIWTSAGGTGEDTFQELVKGASGYTAGTVYTGASVFGTGICITPDYLFEVAAGIPSQSVSPGVAVLNLSTQAQTSIYPDEGFASLSGCSVDHAGNLYLPDNGQLFSGIEVFNAAGTLLNTFAMPSPNADNQYFGPQEMAIDGLGNSFLAAYVYDANSGGSTNFPETIAEFSSTGAQIGPTYGYAPTTGFPNSGDTGLVGLVSPIVTDPGGVAVDGSGNLWLSGTPAGGLPGYVTEVIGIAAPVVTPKPVALSNNTIAMRP
jgi:hypothetical protein